MNTPLVSIIIPTYNRAHLIVETLDSILVQTYENWECIIVDDDSTDNTAEVVNRYVQKNSRFQYHHRPEDRLPGGNAARNYGFEISKGEYVNWFDSDDIMLSDFLQNAIELFKNSKIDFVLFDYKVFKGEINDVVSVQKNMSQNLIEDYVTFKINFGTWAFVWKRYLISDIKFNEKLKKAQDLDFNFRVLTTLKYKYIIANNYGLLIRAHSNSIVQKYRKNNFESAKSELYVRKKVFVYMVKHCKSEIVNEKCFKLFVNPFMKILRCDQFLFLFKEVFTLLLMNKTFFLKNFIWFLKLNFLLLINCVFSKCEYKLKHELLKFKYN